MIKFCVLPAACNVVEVALAMPIFAQTQAANKGLHSRFIQAFSLFAGSSAKGGIKILGHNSNGVLHAHNIGIAGIKCRHIHS